MKMVKSLLLGSAAGVVAVATGQAADLPVKAKPVEYVKVCSLYGAGFFYIPGTDKCIKIGGLLREQWDIHSAGDEQVYMNTTSGSWTRGFTNDSSFRTRSVITVDVREQSSFGTVRAYTAFGAQQTTPNDPNSALYFTRSFVQFAGFTGGRAVSFFDFISTDPYSYSNMRANFGNTGATGINVFAYTAQLGNGVSATISAEDNCAANTALGGSPGARGCFVVNTAARSAGVGTLPPGVATYSPMGYRQPDVVGSLRADQAWGSAQIMAAYHPVQGNYWGTVASGAGEQDNGHPGDEAGFAVGAGFLLKDFLGMQGDTLGVQGGWTRGAVAYLANGTGPLAGLSGGDNGLGNSLAFGHAVDGVYTTNQGIELTTGWNIGAIYEHHWNPQWKTSVFGGYVSLSYNDTATNYICTGTGSSTFVRGGRSTALSALANGTGSFVSSCDPDFSYWSVGTRTQWNPNSNLDLGLDLVWNRLNSAHSGYYVSSTSFGGRPAGTYNIADYDIWTAAIRAQYNFLP